MEIVLTNPLGLWALLGIPAVIAIHFLQQQSREILITTRFLLEQMQKESVEGRKLDRLRNSIPLWLQLLLVLLLSWLLIAPRWKRADSVQRTAVVLDSSASMQAFKDEMIAELLPLLRDLGRNANQAEFVILDSHLANESLYHGADLDELEAVLAPWVPLQGTHDAVPALQVAHSLVGPEGTIIYATDHLVEELPFDAKILAVGKPVANCGFTGLRVTLEDGLTRWRVVARNYSNETQTRSWHLEAAGKSSPAQTVTLEPRQTMVLQGGFPEGAEACTLNLEPDAFPLDDRIPVVRATPKKLFVRKTGSTGYDKIFNQVYETLENLAESNEDNPADLVFASYDPVSPAFPEAHAVLGITERFQAEKILQGAVVAENHPLMADLNWQSLVCRSSMSVPNTEADEVLLWQGKRPLIMLRRIGDFRQLIFNFEITDSNAERLPAFIVLLHRFAEDVRKRKVALESMNAETGQPLRISVDQSPGAADIVLKYMRDGTAASETVAAANAGILRAPRETGFFQVTQGDTHVVHGAAHFADTREADFKDAVSINNVGSIKSTLVERHTRDDPYWRIWVVALGTLLLLNWYFVGRRRVLATAIAAQ